MARRRNSYPPTLERKIHFYRTDVGRDGGGKPITFDPSPALAVIGRLPFSDGDGGRYLVDDDGDAVCVWPGNGRSLPTLRFSRIRRTGLPQLEQAGNVSDLNIAADAGLLETVHVAFFADNIVGADFNFYGPRLSRLGFYLRNKSKNAVPMASFYPLLRGDVAVQLDYLTDIRLFDLRVKAPFVDAIRQADQSLGDAFAATARVLDGDADELELILRPSKGGRIKARQSLLSSLKTLVRRPELRENADRFQIRGKHDDLGHVIVIDLLRDQLIARKQILRLGDRSRAVDSDSAFEAIKAAHDDLHEELRQASSLAS